MTMRMPLDTKNKIESLKNITDYETFLVELIDLLKNYYESEIYHAIKFSQETGQPVEYEWKPYEKVSPIIYLHGGFRKTIQVSEEIRVILEDIILNWPAVFKYQDELYVIDVYYSSYDGRTVKAGVKIKTVSRYNEL